MSRQSHRQFHEPDVDTALPSIPDLEIIAALGQAQRRFEATFLHAPVGIAHVGLDGQFLLVNPRFCEISGYDADTLIRTGFRQITHPDDLHVDEALLARLHAGELPRYTMEKRYIRLDGTVIWINLTVAMARDEADRPEFFVAVIEDMSDLRKASFEAIHDPLTGLLNRRGFACRAQNVLADAGRSGSSVSLLFLDLDGFKQINDNRGHSAGDACLVEIASLLRDHAVGQDMVARVGGDEFLMLVQSPDPHATQDWAEELRSALAALPLGVSGSIGLVTTAPGDVPNLDRLIACADRAMLAAKRAGKNQVRIAPLG
ncbi:MAG: diguanylate cyclase [Sphingomonadaceae bacterium]|nr:diguanylate cyclase [Sphingomonadaceae bacterium]